MIELTTVWVSKYKDANPIGYIEDYLYHMYAWMFSNMGYTEGARELIRGSRRASLAVF